jgi:acyl-CoA hydrolase
MEKSDGRRVSETRLDGTRRMMPAHANPADNAHGGHQR